MLGLCDAHALRRLRARLLIQAGIVGIVYGPGKTSMPEAEFDAAREMLEEAGVTMWEHRRE